MVNIANKLQIFIVTYNRSVKLNQTLKALLSDESPVRECNIIVLDNKSNDDTQRVVEKYRAKSNLLYIKNNYNIGANANIARAYELAKYDYLWILADDDNYDFSSWKEVEHAIENGQKIIVVSKYALNKCDDLDILCQCTFTPAVILSRSMLDDTVLRNIYDSIFTMYVQLVPIVMGLNSGIGFTLIKGKSIVMNGDDYGAKNVIWHHSDNYHRGAEYSRLYYRNATMSQPVGIANAISILKRYDIKQQFMNYQIEVAVHFWHPFGYDLIHFSDLWVNFTGKQKLKVVIGIVKKYLGIYRSGNWYNIKIFRLKTHIFPRLCKMFR